ncbi:DUF484 family protein [Granulosicoccaceae sp. 1_MG-2023]|nr:DUF484 family protein [Granulosicoccaceae sp. 1_MG-2023]
MTTPETAGCRDITDADFVADFLSRNTDFFCEYPHLLTQITVPHQSGKAVSLVERQVEMYREKCRNLESHLRMLSEVAESNEQLNRRIHSLSCDVIACKDVVAVENMLHDRLKNRFTTDALSFHFIHPGLIERNREQAFEVRELQYLRESMKSRNVLCGRLTAAQKESLFGRDAEMTASAALLWLSHGETEFGLMVMGSRDEARFSSDKGVVFLDQIRELVSHKLYELL